MDGVGIFHIFYTVSFSWLMRLSLLLCSGAIYYHIAISIKTKIFVIAHQVGNIFWLADAFLCFCE